MLPILTEQDVIDVQKCACKVGVYSKARMTLVLVCVGVCACARAQRLAVGCGQPRHKARVVPMQLGTH